MLKKYKLYQTVLFFQKKYFRKRFPKFIKSSFIFQEKFFKDYSFVFPRKKIKFIETSFLFPRKKIL
jgi:hypothetical protein